MPLRLIRFVALFLIPCLVADPTTAATFVSHSSAPASPIRIPARWGRVTEVCDARSRLQAAGNSKLFPRTLSLEPRAPLVVLIQDLHGNVGVQRNIAEILKHLASKQQLLQVPGSRLRKLFRAYSLEPRAPLTVFVEGAHGPFDVSVLRRAPNRSLQRLAVDHFLSEGKLAGSEIAAIESKTPIHLWGIDDKTLYRKNLQAFYEASRHSPVPHPKHPAWQRYYAIAQERNIPLVLNALTHVDLLNRTAAAPWVVSVVVGGHHTEGLTRLLKAQQIPYCVVTPRVASLGDEHRYVQRLRACAEEARRHTLPSALMLAIIPIIFLSTSFPAEASAFLAQVTPHSSHLGTGSGVLFGISFFMTVLTSWLIYFSFQHWRWLKGQIKWYEQNLGSDEGGVLDTYKNRLRQERMIEPLAIVAALPLSISVFPFLLNFVHAQGYPWVYGSIKLALTTMGFAFIMHLITSPFLAPWAKKWKPWVRIGLIVEILSALAFWWFDLPALAATGSAGSVGTDIAQASLFQFSPLVSLGIVGKKLWDSMRPRPTFVSPAAAGFRNAVGTFMPLFQMRSKHDWGVSDFYTMKTAVDLHHALGQNFIQVAPFNISSANNSPYSVASSRAIDPIYTSIDHLAEKFAIPGIRQFIESRKDRINTLRQNPRVDYEAIRNLKTDALKMGWESFRAQKGSVLYKEFERFRLENSDWLEDHLLYLELKKAHMREDPFRKWDWRIWEDGLRSREVLAIAEAKRKYKEEILFGSFVQFVADRQFRSLRDYGRQQGVELMVDIPFALDGADIWISPEVFGLKRENGYQRMVTQGVPPEVAYPAGQYWQFYPYDWSNPKTLPFLLDLFRFNQQRATYIRLDHVLGYYRTYLFTEDVNAKMTLKELGLYQPLRELQEAVKAGTKNQGTATQEANDLIQNTIKEMRNSIPERLRDTLPPDSLLWLFDEEGNIRLDNMILIARQVPPEQAGQELPKGTRWRKREYVVEKAVHRGESKWDFTRITPNAQAQDRGFLSTYLFSPEAGDVRENDSIRLGYFKRAPGEAVMSEFLRVAQEQGTTLIWETVGVVPPEIQNSVERLGGTNYLPMIWWESPFWDTVLGRQRNPFHPTHHIKNAFVTFGLHDSTTLRNRWEKEYSKELKEGLLDPWFGPDGWDLNDRISLTPKVQRKLLEMVYTSEPRVAVLNWLDLLGLGEEYRLNAPGVQEGQWQARLPEEYTLEDLLAAARGDLINTNPKAEEAVALIQDMTRMGNRIRPSIDSRDIKILQVNPEVGGGVVQIRKLDTTPFLVDTYVQGNAKRLSVVIKNGEQQIHVPMKPVSINPHSGKHGVPEGVSKWSALWRPNHVGLYKFHVEIDGTRIKSAEGHLVAVESEADLSPLSKTYRLGQRFLPVAAGVLEGANPLSKWPRLSSPQGKFTFFLPIVSLLAILNMGAAAPTDWVDPLTNVLEKIAEWVGAPIWGAALVFYLIFFTKFIKFTLRGWLIAHPRIQRFLKMVQYAAIGIVTVGLTLNPCPIWVFWDTFMSREMAAVVVSMITISLFGVYIQRHPGALRSFALMGIVAVVQIFSIIGLALPSYFPQLGSAAIAIGLNTVLILSIISIPLGHLIACERDKSTLGKLILSTSVALISWQLMGPPWREAAIIALVTWIGAMMISLYENDPSGTSSDGLSARRLGHQVRTLLGSVEPLSKKRTTKLGALLLLATLLLAPFYSFIKSYLPWHGPAHSKVQQISPLNAYYKNLQELSPAGREDLWKHLQFPAFTTSEDLTPFLKAIEGQEGTMLGVSFEQNFSFISQANPSRYYIVDKNPMITEVLVPFYGRLMELAPTRAEFLSRLMSAPVTEKDVETLFRPFGGSTDYIFQLLNRATPQERERRYRRLERVLKDEILGKLSATSNQKEQVLRWVSQFLKDPIRNPSPQFFQFLNNHVLFKNTWLHSEENYQRLRASWLEGGKIVGITANLMDAKSLKSIGDKVAQRGDEVSMMYLSDLLSSFAPGQQIQRTRDFLEKLGQFPHSGDTRVLVAYPTGLPLSGKVWFYNRLDWAYHYLNTDDDMIFDRLIISPLLEYPDALAGLWDGISQIRSIPFAEKTLYWDLFRRIADSRSDIRSLTPENFTRWAKTIFSLLNTDTPYFRAVVITLVEAGIIQPPNEKSVQTPRPEPPPKPKLPKRLRPFERRTALADA